MKNDNRIFVANTSKIDWFIVCLKPIVIHITMTNNQILILLLVGAYLQVDTGPHGTELCDP
jgi:hypothetical protein